MTVFPTTVDVFTNPIAIDPLSNPPHAQQHADANDAIEAIESYVLTLNQTVNNLTSSTSIYTNVKDPTYGAEGDGVTDDTAAIQAAIDDLEARAQAERGVIYFPPGVYMVSAPLTIEQNGIVLMGSGTEDWGPIGLYSIIEAAAGFAGGTTLLRIDAKQNAIHRLQLDGSTHVARTLDVSRTDEARGFRMTESSLRGGTDYTLYTNLANRAYFAFNQIRGQDGQTATARYNGSDMIVVGDRVNSDYTSVAGVVAQIQSSGGLIQGCHFTDGVTDLGADRTFLNGCYFDGGEPPLRIAAGLRFVQITNCFIRKSAATLDDTVPGIACLTSASDIKNLMVNNCIFEGRSSTGRLTMPVDRGATSTAVKQFTFIGNQARWCRTLWSSNGRPMVASGNSLISDAGANDIRPQERMGLSEFTATGATTFLISPGGLAKTSEIEVVTVQVQPASTAAFGDFTAISTGGNILVTYATAPPIGTTNVHLYWHISI